MKDVFGNRVKLGLLKTLLVNVYNVITEFGIAVT